MKTVTQYFNPLRSLTFGISIMDRYLMGELIAPFLFGSALFSSVAVAIGSLDLVRKVTEAGLPLSTALKVFVLKMPFFIAFSLPASMLLATLLAYSRLSGDSELIALRSCGVSAYRLILPAIFMSFVVTGIAFTFNELVVPAANYQAELTLDIALKQDRKDFQENNIIYPEFGEVEQANGEKLEVLKRLFYAEQFDGEVMKNITIVDRSRTGVNQIVVSESAQWNTVENTWDFFNGTIYLISPDSSYRNILRFEHHQLQLPRAPLDFAKKRPKADEMNIAQVQEQIKLIKPSGDYKEIRKLNIRLQQKIALPFACLVFGLVGAVMGTRPQRTNRATGFGISVLIIFAYYLLRTMGDALGMSGFLSPWMAAWLPNLFGLGMGTWLLLRISR
ncbi:MULTISPECIES: LptF/LptG family permease [Oscillatoriales]|nr:MULTISPECIES: LptF/LptG family permease [Oscillatoriales]